MKIMAVQFKSGDRHSRINLSGSVAPALCGAVVCAFLCLCCPTLLKAVDFQSDVRIVLSDKCFKCHGPAEDGRKAGLRLDTLEGSRIEADSGLRVIEPGSPESSELIKRIFSSDPDDVMPPPESKMTLSEEEKTVLETWVSEGANYDVHWSFLPVRKPPVPEIQTVDGEPANPVDAFILEKLQQKGMDFEPVAPREKLLRRVSFDLTGLPPTAEELQNFIDDPSGDAYERRVDDLLRRHSYGERMASEWLDVARYSDTYGYQVDRDRFVWPWRDWVINAFNDNLPYDTFIEWQLAGDLLPDATREQILATTFNRLHPQKVEGGSVPEEFRVEYVADRTHTFGTAFLGLTLECARCHDHKYDPITQKDYYQFSSFFDNIDEAGLYSFFTSSVPTPTLTMPDSGQEAELKRLSDRIHSTGGSLDQLVAGDAFAEAAGKWVSVSDGASTLPEPVAHFDFNTLDGGKIANLIDSEKPASTGGGNRIEEADGSMGAAIRLTGDDAVNLPVGNFSRDQPFSIATRIMLPEEFERSVIFHRSRAWTDAGSRGYEFLVLEGYGQFSLIHFWPGNAISIRTNGKLPVGEWIDLAVTYDGSADARGLSIYLNGSRAETTILYNNLYKNITGGGGDNIAIGERFRDRGFKNGLMDEFAVWDTLLTGPELSALKNRLDAVDLTALKGHSPEQLATLYAWRGSDKAATLRQDLQSLHKERNAIKDSLSEIMVMQESRTPHQTYFLDRGHYESRKFPVESMTPAVLHPLKSRGANPDRLDLARWLTARDNPLTARVTVNRYWQMIFGRGLVTTPEDFGFQGSAPTHPKLLDWLAAEFMDRGWDVRWLLRTMVTSRAYTQDSITSPEKRKLDPENRLLGRGRSYRIAAEMIRDNALAVSGLLVDKVGGEPVRPYEVEQSFKFANRQKGEALYRRSLYTWWKRTGPAPTMLALDASKRDVCTVRRERTATPIQAFIYLNDPQFVEASRTIAMELWNQEIPSVSVALSDIFMRLISRKPTDRETRILVRMFNDQKAYFDNHPDRAMEYLSTGDSPLEEGRIRDRSGLAAVAAVTSALFAHDECVMKR